MDQKIAIQKAFKTLCEAIQMLERSVAPVANPRLLRECSKLRRQASEMMLEVLHPRERETSAHTIVEDRENPPLRTRKGVRRSAD